MPDSSEVEKRVHALIVSLFPLADDVASSELRLGNPPEWDSIGHMQLLVAIEENFKIRFPNHEIARLVTIEAISKAIQALNEN